MKKSISTLLIVLLSITVYAQRDFSNFTPKKLPDVVAEDLKLEGDTQKKLNKSFVRLQEDIINTMVSARESGNVDRNAIKNEMESLRTEHLEQAKTMLDDETYQKYAEFVMMDRRKRQAYVMELKLKLTPDQKEKYDAILASSDATIEKLREQHKGDREAMREAIMPIKKQEMMMLSQVLTEQQMEILKSSRQGKGGKKRRNEQ